MTSQSAASDEPEDRRAAASYISALSGDLALMARRHGLDTLGYILEMAKLEAENISRSQPQ
jgi:hypothetical protein